MRLRHLLHHVRAQNWVAVGLDLLIVVVGVFIGIQVSNWNDARRDQRREQVYLARLDAEMDVILDRLGAGVDVYRQSTESAQLLLQARRIHRGAEAGPVPTDLEIRDALRMLRAGRVPAGSPAAFRQMVSSGELTLLRNDALRDALFRYDEFASIARDVWRTGREEFLLGYATIVPIVRAVVDFAPDTSRLANTDTADYRRQHRALEERSPYTIAGFARDPFFESNDLDGALELMMGAIVNLYEVIDLQLEIALEIDSLIAWERETR
jgi:hypothetical protein